MTKMMIAAAALSVAMMGAPAAQAGNSNGILSFSETSNYRIPPAQMNRSHTRDFRTPVTTTRNSAMRTPPAVQTQPGTNRIVVQPR